MTPRVAVRLGVVTDVHITVDPSARERWHHELDLQGARDRLRTALELLAADDVDLVLVCGDLTHFGDAASLDTAVATLADGPSPAVVIPGNHDVLQRPDALQAAVERVGAGRVRIATHTGEQLAPGLLLAGRADTPVVGAASPGAVAPWGDDIVLWLSHFPALSIAQQCASAGLADAGDAADVAEATRLLATRDAPTIALSGHYHVRHAMVRGAVLQLGAAALVEPPGDVGVIEIDIENGIRVTWRWRSLAAAGGLRLPILAPEAGELVLDSAGCWQAPAPLPGPTAAALRRHGLAAVAFDWNGTLVNDREAAWHATATVMARRGRPNLERREFADAFRLPLTALFEDLGADDPPEAAREWNELMAHTAPALMPGALEVLLDLRAAGVALGVVSAAAADVVTTQVVQCGLADVIDFVVAGPAPKREPLTLLDRLAPGRVAYVGDTEYDIKEALAGGARALGWAHGYRPAEALRAAGAERILDEMAELIDLAGLPSTRARRSA